MWHIESASMVGCDVLRGWYKGGVLWNIESLVLGGNVAYLEDGNREV
jgi:hypothetical protein